MFFYGFFLNQVKSPCKEPPFGRICLELLPFRRHFKQTQLDVFCFSTGSLTLNFDPPIGTHISFMFRGYNPYWGFKTFIFLWCWGPRELFTCLENIGFRTIFLLGNWKYLVLGVSSWGPNFLNKGCFPGGPKWLSEVFDVQNPEVDTGGRHL